MKENLSVCVITKNEEKNITVCLDSIKTLNCEMVVVDTGSTDNTVQIAREFGAEIYEYRWNNDFAAAKNYAISKAKGKWILFIDADEYVPSSSLSYLNEVISQADNSTADVVSHLLTNYDNEKQKIKDTVMTVRLFRNTPKIRYRGRIHERLFHEDHPILAFDASKFINIMHTGYTQSEIERKNKAQRNLALILAEVEENPGKSDLYFYVSESYLMAQNYKKGFEYANKVLECNNSELLGTYEKNYNNIVVCMEKLEYSKREIINVLLEGIQKCENSPELQYVLGEYYYKENMFFDAIESFENGIKKLGSAFRSVSNAHITLPKVLNILSNLYYYTGDLQKCVQKHIETLKMDKYLFESIHALFLIFTKYESAKDIFGLLQKIYNYNIEKDVVFLLKAAIHANNAELAEMYLLTLDVDESELLRERAQICLIKEEFEKAYQYSKKLYLMEYDKRYAAMCTTAAMLLYDQELLLDISQLVKPSIKRIVDGYKNESIQVLEIDKKDLLDLMKEAIKLNAFDKIDYFTSLTSKLNLWMEVAELAYYYERFDISTKCYYRCLENDGLGEKSRANIYYKLARALYEMKQLDQALELLWEAWKVNNEDFKVYELAARIGLQAGCLEYLKPMMQDALMKFPYSKFIKSITVGDDYE